jgi:DNA-binding MarR family transcriptional regulator
LSTRSSSARGGDERAERAERAEHVVNVFGALALAITDRVQRAVTEVAGTSESDATVLSALQQFLDRSRVDRVASVLALTSSGTSRLVDRLVDAGLARRERGDDARATTVMLTAAGRRRARRVSDARREVLDNALGVLTPAERAEFGRLVDKVLGGIARPGSTVGWICRLCDLGACGRDEGRCPAANAAAEWSR